MKKYLVDVIRGYETTITMAPIFGTGESHSIPFTVRAGIRVCRTKREALVYIERTKQNGGEAVMVK